MAADYKINKIYVCSPYHSEYNYKISENVEFARKACRFVCSHGKEYMPIAPHLLFPQFMNDDDIEERGTAINYGLHLITLCDEIWVFGDTFSTGMATEVAFAHLLITKNIRFYREDSDAEGGFFEIKP